MKEKILITGSTGFVGKHLVPRLVDNGYQVMEITRDILKSKSLFKDTTCKLIDSDIRFNEKIEDFQPEIVIHLASYLSSSDEWHQIENMINANLLFFTKVLNAVSRLELKLFVNTGSFSEYSTGRNEVVPAYYYSATKTASRSILDYYSRNYNFKQATVVPYTIYGGMDSQKKVIDILFDSTLTDVSIKLSPGEQILDFIHIEDVTSLYTAIVGSSNKLPNKVEFKVGTGLGHSLKDVATFIEEITNRKTNVSWGAIPYRNSDVMYAVADLSLCKEILGWKPEIDLKSGIEKMIQIKEFKS